MKTRWIQSLISLALLASTVLVARGEAPDAPMALVDKPNRELVADTSYQDEQAILGATPHVHEATHVDEGPEGIAPPRGFDPQEALQEERDLLYDINKHRTAIGKAPVETTVGGDDVLIMSAESIAQTDAYDIEIAENGDIYVAVEVYDATTNSEIRVYRSDDDGDTWDLWGVRAAASFDVTYRNPAMVLGEGNEDRVYLAYSYRNWAGATGSSVNVARANMAGASATWTVSSVFVPGPGDHFRDPEIASDSGNFQAYRVFVVAEEDDGSATDIWFARSTDFGATFITQQEIATLGGNTTDYYNPHVAYGSGGRVHVTWYRATFSDETVDDAVRYRRGLNWGGTWNDPVMFLTPTNDGFNQQNPSIAGDLDGSQVALAYTQYPDGGGYVQNLMWPSVDGGATWNALDVVEDEHVLYPDVIETPDGYCLWGAKWLGTGYGFTEAPEVDPTDMADPEIMMDDTYFGHGIVHAADGAFNPTKGNRIAMIVSERDDGPDYLWFDAEWRGDPGYPNLDPNFPVPLASEPDTPPALADVDRGTRSDLEIVFADKATDIHVIDRLGQELPGFPVTVGEDISDESLAVGDLNGDGFVEIAVGTDDGHVFIYDYQGNLLPGFPTTVGSGPTYVSIGTVSRRQKRDVVAVSGDQINLVRYLGGVRTEDNWPVTNPNQMSAAAALGDLDQDGDVEVVVVGEDKLRVYNSDGSQSILRTMAGTDLVQTPSLGDLDYNGDLEIMVPTDTGEVWAFEHVGANHPGYPINIGSPDLTEIAIAEAAFGFALTRDFAVSAQNWEVWLYSGDGILSLGWPNNTTANWFLLGSPIIDDNDGGLANVFTGDRGDTVHGWHAQIFDMDGFPKDVGAQVNHSLATGDVTSNGDMHIVVLTEEAVLLLDTNLPLTNDPDQRWPQYGHDAQRTSCANCPVDLITAVGPTEVNATQFFLAPPSPNPAPGRTTFSYRIPERSTVKLEIFDVRGRRVRTLVKEEAGAGDYQIGWDGQDDTSRDVSYGQYFARLSIRGALNASTAQKVLLVP